jgi:two-component system CheB/CheR fusion protein
LKGIFLMSNLSARERPALASLPLRVQPAPTGRRVLVVEDNRDAADTLGLLLQMQGHDVLVAYNGTDGIGRAASWEPDVVLCDIGLPGIDGFEVARRLRRQPGTERALLVAITGYGTEQDRRRGFEAGFDHYLVKPADPDDLRRLLAGAAR